MRELRRPVDASLEKVSGRADAAWLEFGSCLIFAEEAAAVLVRWFGRGSCASFDLGVAGE